MATIDGFILAAPDARIAVVVVAVTQRWSSVRGLTVPEIAGQLGCTTAAFALFGQVPATSRLLFKRSVGRVQAE
jgi:hypothetical protein